MNKFKVGQRVKIIRTGKIGEIAELDNEDFDKEGRSNNCYGVKYKGWRYSYWFTVHDLEKVKEPLDIIGKDYLHNVIRPFRDKIISIIRIEGKSYSYIRIVMNSSLKDIELPYFKNKERYEDMEEGKPYTLEELGL